MPTPTCTPDAFRASLLQLLQLWQRVLRRPLPALGTAQALFMKVHECARPRHSHPR